VDPPVPAAGFEGVIGQVGDHEDKDKQCDEAAFGGDLAEPFGLDDEAAGGQASDGDGNGYGKDGDEAEIDAAERGLAGNEDEAVAEEEVVERRETKSAEAPEDECMGDTGKRAVANDFSLEHDLPEEFASPSL